MRWQRLLQRGRGLRELYGATRFRDAAEVGAEALKGGPLTAFEKLCDDAVGDYLAGAPVRAFRRGPSGKLSGRTGDGVHEPADPADSRAAGIDPAVIRTRLRASYVRGGAMATTYRIAVIGSWESVMGFRPWDWRRIPSPPPRRPGRPSGSWQRAATAASSI